MNNFNSLVNALLCEASPSKLRRGVGAVLHKAGDIANVLKDPYRPTGPQTVSQALKKAGDILSPNPSKMWSASEAPSTTSPAKSTKPLPTKFKDRDYFYIVINNKPFAGRIVKVTGEYVFIKLFNHPEYGSAVALVKQRVPELFFYKEKIPKGNSRYLDYVKARISYNERKKHWVAVTK